MWNKWIKEVKIPKSLALCDTPVKFHVDQDSHPLNIK